jgi:cytoskeletal protein CcmA (bactofilin family)
MLKLNSEKFPACVNAIRVLVLGLALAGSALVPAQTQAPASPAAATLALSRNVYASGGSVRTGSAIEGDFVAAGGRVVLDQPVKDDALLAGGSVDVRAPVGDDVRAAAGDVTIESSIGGELAAAGGAVTLTKGARVAGAASLAAGGITIEGKIDGPLKASGRKIVLNGEVGGDARLLAQQIELGPNAKINGALSYASPNELQKAEGASIGGAVTRDTGRVGPRGDYGDREWSARPWGGGVGWGGSVFGFLALLASAALLLLVFPVFSVRASNLVRASPWLALAAGFGTLVGAPVLAVLLFITLLGIPLGIVVLALYPALLLMGYVVGVLFVGRSARTALRKNAAESFASTMGYFALALLLLLLLAGLPFVGGLVVAAITVIGIGACVLELVGRRQAHSAPAARAGDAGSAQPQSDVAGI